jgi:hypothetical protein
VIRKQGSINGVLLFALGIAAEILLALASAQEKDWSEKPGPAINASFTFNIIWRGNAHKKNF